MILSFECGRLTEKKSYREALHLESEVSPVLSITGAGGKTTTALRLACEYKNVGNPAVVTTSTHLAIWDQPWFLLEESMEKLQQIRKRYGQVWVGISMEKRQKMKAVSETFFKKICELEVPVIVEADGARRMPCKVPAAHEPVILPQTTTVCSVVWMLSDKESVTAVFGRNWQQKCLKKGKQTGWRQRISQGLRQTEAAGERESKETRNIG